MRGTALILILILAANVISYSQRQVMELSFSAVNNTTWIQLDSLKVVNRTSGVDTLLIYPDTLLVLDIAVGIPVARIENQGFRVYQNYPNPVAEQTNISLFLPGEGQVTIMVTDILGKRLVGMDKRLDKGTHTFRLTMGEGSVVFFTALWNGHIRSSKIIHAVRRGNMTTNLEYIGMIPQTTPLKSEMLSDRAFSYCLGDELLYTGFIDTLQSAIPDTPEVSTSYSFQFATNIPCPGTPTVEYEGHEYSTIQVFSQCWLKENLDVGTMIYGLEDMQDDGMIEKYCFNNNPSNCEIYGGLYQWDEMMQYVTLEGGQGICPPAWHIPSDEEWKVLEGAVDSQFGIGDPAWDLSGQRRGYDAGSNLKSADSWNSGGNGMDPYGFSLLAGGARGTMGFAATLGWYSSLWTSSESPDGYSWHRQFGFSWQDIYRGTHIKAMGFSVRCLKDQLP